MYNLNQSLSFIGEFLLTCSVPMSTGGMLPTFGFEFTNLLNQPNVHIHITDHWKTKSFVIPIVNAIQRCNNNCGHGAHFWQTTPEINIICNSLFVAS